MDPARDARVEAWLLDIRTEGGTIRAATCGSPDSPAFTQDTDFVRLDAGDDGSTTAIAIGTYDFSASTFGMSVPLCNVVAIENPSANPADHLTAGTANTDFTTHTDAANLSCDVTYTGTAPDSLAAYSLAVTISDNVNADNTGAADPAVDDTIAVTVKLLNIRTDQAALMALYRATGGDAWTTSMDWNPEFTVEHTFGVTPGTGSNFVGVTNIVGSLSNNLVTLSGREYDVGDLQRYTSGGSDGNLRLAASPGTPNAPTDFGGKSLRIKGNTYAFADASTTGTDVNFYIAQWTNTPATAVHLRDAGQRGPRHGERRAVDLVDGRDDGRHAVARDGAGPAEQRAAREPSAHGAGRADEADQPRPERQRRAAGHRARPERHHVAGHGGPGGHAHRARGHRCGAHVAGRAGRQLHAGRGPAGGGGRRSHRPRDGERGGHGGHRARRRHLPADADVRRLAHQRGAGRGRELLHGTCRTARPAR